MSLLMEALKRAETAKLATAPSPPEKPPIAEELPPLSITAPEETVDEVSVWQQQLLSEISEQSHFIIEDSQAVPAEELLIGEATHDIDWESSILPEFQQVLAEEKDLEPLVLEDNRSNLSADEEPEIVSETEFAIEATPALVLNFSREIAPDLSLNELHQAPTPTLKLEWEDELLSAPPPFPPESSADNQKTPPISEPSQHPSTSDESTAQAQRDEIKRLFQASLQRKPSSRWMYAVAMLLIMVGTVGLYGIYHEKLVEQYIDLFNNQLEQNVFLISKPNSAITTVPPPVELVKPQAPEVKSPPPPPTLVQVASPEPPPVPPKNPPAIPPAPPPTPVVQPEVTKSAFPREQPIEPKIEPKLTVESKQPTENKEIQIIHSGQKSQAHPRLLQAYTALQRGDDKTALNLYHTVLKQEARNRDALLGLAAIAVRQRQFSQATQYYQEVLKNYPQDTVAKTNLLSLSEQVTGEARESQLKTLVSNTQKPAYIHFQLGLVYAQQERWNEAQQAFFEAYRFEPQQADYAYNLAVSLEHLHQSQAAVAYYQRAVQLQQKQKKSYSFQLQVVQQRIATLQATTQRQGITNALNESE